MTETIVEPDSITGVGLVRTLPNGGVFAAELDLLVDRHRAPDGATVLGGCVRATNGGLPSEGGLLEIRVGDLAVVVNAAPMVEPNVSSVATA